MGFGAKLVTAATLTVSLFEFHLGYCMGHYFGKTGKPKYEAVEKQGVEMIVDNKTDINYIQADITNVLMYASQQDTSRLEQALKKKNESRKYD